MLFNILPLPLPLSSHTQVPEQRHSVACPHSDLHKTPLDSTLLPSRWESGPSGLWQGHLLGETDACAVGKVEVELSRQHLGVGIFDGRRAAVFLQIAKRYRWKRKRQVMRDMVARVREVHRHVRIRTRLAESFDEDSSSQHGTEACVANARCCERSRQGRKEGVDHFLIFEAEKFQGVGFLDSTALRSHRRTSTGEVSLLRSHVACVSKLVKTKRAVPRGWTKVVYHSSSQQYLDT